MSERHDGGPAFPGTNQQRLQTAMRALMDAAKREDIDGVAAASQECADAIERGMSLRDYFAAKAMAVLMLREDCFENADKCAAWAYEQADAMLKERAK